jgi:hypothetical protein
MLSIFKEFGNVFADVVCDVLFWPRVIKVGDVKNLLEVNNVDPLLLFACFCYFCKRLELFLHL